MVYQFGVLGPINVWRNGREIDPGPPQQATVLATLLLAGGRPVTLDRLVSNIWPYDCPHSAAGTVRTYVSRLRKVLSAPGPSMIIHSDRNGYSIAPSVGTLDAAEFRRLVREGSEMKASCNRAAADKFRQALDLWRGTALSALRGEFVEAERTRLERLRLDAAEEYLALAIKLGLGVEVSGEISKLLREHPMEERLYELQMLDLYQSSRQGEALHVYRRVREKLVGEMGIEPGPGLQALHQGILRGDPGLVRVRVTRHLGVHPTAETGAIISGSQPAASGKPADVDISNVGWNTLSDRLRRSREQRFVGREEELAIFSNLIRAANTGGYSILFYHNSDSVGKSTLLHILADQAREFGYSVTAADGFLAELDSRKFFDVVNGAISHSKSVLFIDGFENCDRWERWIYEHFLLQLKRGSLVVIAGRAAPSRAWRSDPGWADVLLVRRLRDLTRRESVELLANLGVAATLREPVVQCVGGHPLALTVAADAVKAASIQQAWPKIHTTIHEILFGLDNSELGYNAVIRLKRTSKPQNQKLSGAISETTDPCPHELWAAG